MQLHYLTQTTDFLVTVGDLLYLFLKLYCLSCVAVQEFVNKRDHYP